MVVAARIEHFWEVSKNNKICSKSKAAEIFTSANSAIHLVDVALFIDLNKFCFLKDIIFKEAMECQVT